MKSLHALDERARSPFIGGVVMADEMGKLLPLRKLRSRTPIDHAIGQRIAEHRRRMGLELGALATAADTTPVMIERYEAGAERVPVDKLLAIAAALDVPLAYLFG